MVDNFGDVASQTFSVTTTSAAINAATLNSGSNQSLPSIASDGEGDYTTVWYGDGPGGYAIYGQQFGPDGTAFGGNFQASPAAAAVDGVFKPVIGMQSDGDFVVAWEGLGTDGYESIWAQQFNADGTTAGAAFQVNAAGTTASEPSIAMSDDGSFVIAWYGNASAAGWGVYIQQFGSGSSPGTGDGDEGPTATDAAFLVAGYGASEPAIGMDSNDDFVVAWNWSQSIYAAEFAANGSAEQTAFEVTDSSAYGGDSTSSAPAVGMGENGQFAIAWTVPTGTEIAYGGGADDPYADPYEGAGGEVQAMNYTIAGQPVESSPILVDTAIGDAPGAQSLGAAVDGSGYFTVDWYNDGPSAAGPYPLGTEAQVYAPDGDPQSGPSWIDSINPNTLESPGNATYGGYAFGGAGGAAVSTGGAGAFAAAWTHPAWDGNSNAIYTQPLTFTEPLALATPGQPLAAITITAGAAATTLDVSSAFVENGNDDPLVYSVSANSNSSQVTGGFSGSVLSLSAVESSSGSANLVLRATDTATGAFVEVPLTVNILPCIPIINIVGSSAISSGSTYTLTIDVPSAVTPSGLTINWGDGSTQVVPSTTTTITHVFSAAEQTALATDEIQVFGDDQDGNSLYGSNVLPVTVNPVPPTITISGPSTINAGSPYTLNLSSLETDGDTISSWTIYWGDGSSSVVSGNPSTTSHTYSAGLPGESSVYAITATATDQNGTYAASSQQVTVATAAATATISGNSTIDQGAQYQLDLSGSLGDGETITSWTINWGDGSAPQTVAGDATDVTHVYAHGPDAGSNTYRILATAAGGAGSVATNSQPVTVTSAAPAVSISGPGNATQGATYTLALSGSETDGDSITSWIINWGDGTAPQYYSGNITSATHVFTQTAQSGSSVFDIQATAVDPDGSYASNVIGLTVVAPPPTVQIGGAATVSQGAPYSLDLSASETDGDTISSWTINWGDGSAAQTVPGGVSVVTHQYGAGQLPGANTYSISATATDQNGSYSSNNSPVIVTPVAPRVSISGPARATQGSQYSLSLSAIESGNATISQWTINWGDGTAPQVVDGSPSSVTHVYGAGTSAGSNDYTISATATDQNGTHDGGNSQSVAVQSVPALATISGNGWVEAGQTYTLDLASQETDGDTISGWNINWGDGSSVQTITGNPTSVTHVFGSPPVGTSTFLVGAAAIDGDGSYASNTQPVNLVTSSDGQPNAPSVIISGNASDNQDDTYTLSLDAYEPSGISVQGWTINWGDGTSTTIAGDATFATHSYGPGFDPGTNSYQISAVMSDANGFYAAAPLTVKVTSVAPTLAISGAPSVNLGSTYTLDLSSDETDGDTLATWIINWGDGSAPQTVPGDTTSVTHTFVPGGDLGSNYYQITATASDQDGTYGSNTQPVSVDPVAPTVQISGDSTVDEGAPYTLDLSGVESDGESINGWTIYWGDGSAAQLISGNPTSITHVFGPGSGRQSYSIQAIATDPEGTYYSNSQTVAITAVPPTLSISGPSTIDQGSTYTLNLSAAETSGDTVSGWSINWGDGSTQTVEGNQPFVTHVYTTASPSSDPDTIIATATDQDGQYSATQTVAVTAVPPVITVVGSSTDNQGDTYTLDFAAYESDGDTVNSWSVNWGDGQTDTYGGTTTSATHTYVAGPNPGSNTYTITATATDIGGSYAGTQTVTVQSVAPAAIISGNSTSAPNQPYTLDLSAPETDQDTISSWTINWGDGSQPETVSGNPSSLTHSFTLPNGAASQTFVITAAASDQDGTHASNSLPVTVAAPVPTVTISGASAVNLGQEYTLNLASQASDGSSITGWTINWGDGSSPQLVAAGVSSVTHVFQSNVPATLGGDSYGVTITAAASDQNGTYAGNAVPVTVYNDGNGALAPYTIYLDDPNAAQLDLGSTLARILGTNDPLNFAVSDNPDANLNAYFVGSVLYFNTSDDTPGNVQLTIEVTDAKTGASISLTQEVDLVAAQITDLGLLVNAAGGAGLLTGTLTGMSPSLPISLTVDWGDGNGPQYYTLPTGTEQIDLTYDYPDAPVPAAGYQATVTVTAGYSQALSTVVNSLSNFTWPDAPSLTSVPQEPEPGDYGPSTLAAPSFTGTAPDYSSVDEIVEQSYSQATENASYTFQSASQSLWNEYFDGYWEYSGSSYGSAWSISSSAVEAAQSAYQSSLSSIQTTESNSSNQIESAYTNSFNQAQSSYDGAETAAWNSYDDNAAQAFSAENDALGQNGNAFDSGGMDYDAFVCADSNAESAYNVQMAGYSLALGNSLAQAASSEETSFDEALSVANQAQADLTDWVGDQSAAAELTSAQAVNSASYEFASAVAGYSQSYNDALASASQTLDQSLTDATVAEQTGQASAELTYAEQIQTTDEEDNEGSDTWDAYQVALASYQLSYADAISGPETTQGYSDAAAGLTQQQSIDQAQYNHDSGLAGSLSAAQNDVANAEYNLQTAQNDAGSAFNSSVAGLWSSELDASATAELNYAQSMNTAVSITASGYASAANACTQSVFGSQDSPEDAGATEAAADNSISQQFLSSYVSAEGVLEPALSGASASYQENMISGGLTLTSAIDSAVSTAQLSEATAENSYSEAYELAADVLQGAEAGYDACDIETVASDAYVFAQTQLPAQRTLTYNDALALADMKSAAIGEYVAALQTWAAGDTTDSPDWTSFVVSSAEAEQTQILADNSDDLAYAASTAQADETSGLGGALQDKLYAVSQAAAAATMTENIAGEDETRVESYYSAARTQLSATVGATYTYDEAVAGADAGLERLAGPEQPDARRRPGE